MAERRTHDPVARDILERDVARTLDVLLAGGVALVPLDVAYGIVAATPDGIRRIFAAKERSYEKPSGLFANWQLSADLHVMDARRHAIVGEVAREVGIPFSVVAPFRADHPLIRATDPFVLGSSTKSGTIDMLLNAGQFHDELARQSIARGVLVFGSSANTSLSGSKYRLADIDPPVRAAADIAFDFGLSKFVNPEGRSSTIIDFADFSVIRIGVAFDALARAFQERFGIALGITDKTAGRA